MSVKSERKNILNRCIRCGACAAICPGLTAGGRDNLNPVEVQNALYDFLKAPAPETAGAAGRGLLFFPGCNVYKDAPRLVKILKILKQIAPDAAYLPGMEYCCGERFLFDGQPDRGQEACESLERAIAAYLPETVILWCPSCLVRMEKLRHSSVRVISFFQFLRENMDTLTFRSPAGERTVTLHEPCKTAYTGLDRSHRDILRSLPGIRLKEMETEVMCCGSGGLTHHEEAVKDSMTRRRLDEASRTGAEDLVTVCHYCQEVFEGEASDELDVVNLADLLYESLKDLN